MMVTSHGISFFYTLSSTHLAAISHTQKDEVDIEWPIYLNSPASSVVSSALLSTGADTNLKICIVLQLKLSIFNFRID